MCTTNLANLVYLSLSEGQPRTSFICLCQRVNREPRLFVKLLMQRANLVLLSWLDVPVRTSFSLKNGANLVFVEDSMNQGEPRSAMFFDFLQTYRKPRFSAESKQRKSPSEPCFCVWRLSHLFKREPCFIMMNWCTYKTEPRFVVVICCEYTWYTNCEPCFVVETCGWSYVERSIANRVLTQ
jgi:hypothetical protein